MFRSARFRFTLLRHVSFWIVTIFLVKTTSIFYYDLQEHSIDQKRSSLPFEIDSEHLNIDNSSVSTTIESFRQYVEQQNRQQMIFNRHLFTSNRTHYVLLVQVHKRLIYLKKFIEMLQNVETINETLIIFSHDFIDSDINALVRNISFVPVIQIFYPFSQQLYPNEFPGLDPNDCPRDISRHQKKSHRVDRGALLRRCKNAPYPDKYGHYREVSIVQIKHHWWWKLNFVFNSIDILKNREDFLILLLEEDFYLSPDALVFLKQMESEKDKLCPDCLFYTIGNLEKTGRYFNKLGSKVSIAYWHARYNLGMTISHTVWKLLVKYAEEFCTIDDYNWDWSLVYLAQKRFDYPRVLWSSATRLMHLGSCGTHHKKTCSNESDIARWTETERFYQDQRKYLFPSSPLSVHIKYQNKRPFTNTNGGWSDIRDRQLCLSFALSSHSNSTSVQ